LFLGMGGAMAALALAAAFLAYTSTRHFRARCAALESTVATLSRELEIAVSINVRTGRRVQRVEKEYSGVADRVERIESRGCAAIERAIDSARHGAGPSRLTEEFGLTRVEAELIARLHGQ
jgi:hypothetical protein